MLRPSLSICLALWLAGGCRSVPPLRGYTLGLSRVYAPQGHCATAVIMASLDAYGLPYDPDTLDQQLFIPAIGGTLPALMADVAQSHGLPLDVTTGSWPTVRDLVYAHRPPLLVLAPTSGETTGHVVLICGTSHSGHRIRVIDSNGTARWSPSSRFDSAWTQAGRTLLVPTIPLPEQPVPTVRRH